MTLFNDPVRVVGGRVVSLLPIGKTAGGCRPGWTGPRRTWSLAIQAPLARHPEMAKAQGALDQARRSV
jgi:hypothetical protein